MKKVAKILLCTLLLLCIVVSAVACGGNNDNSCSHTFSPEWNNDEGYHWHDATCGHTEISEKAEHTFGEIIIDEEPTPTNKGYGHKVCSVCGWTIHNVEVEFEYDPDALVTLIFDVRGGQAIEPVTVKIGTTINLSDYIVERTDGENCEFEGWIVGDQKVDSVVLMEDTIAHAAYSCDAYMGKQSVKIGKYPQTVVSDPSIIEALDKMEMSDRNSNGYYEYQGNEYAKEICTFDSNAFDYEKGKAYYFKVEPITWVRASGRWTTLHVIDFIDSYNLLEYLNGNFYDSLTEKEKAFIGDTSLNAENPYKFFLWNVDEFASSHQYESDRKQSLTDYALFRDDTRFYKDDRFTTYYWLLNPINSSGIDTISYYTFTDSDWQQDVTYMGKCGLLPCFNFDFNGIKEMTGDDTIRVTFNTNGGSEIPTQVLIAGEKYQLDTPEKADFNFAGWYKDEELKQFVRARDFSSNKDVTLYAKWEEKPKEPDVYNVTYELNGGAFDSSITLDKDFLEGEVITFPNPKKDSTISYDYKFEGWYLEKDFQTKVTSTEGLAENVKVYAKWKEEGRYFYIEYNLSYGESIVEEEYPTKVLCAEGTIDLPTAQYNGYIFLGWKQRGYEELITTLSTNRSPNSGSVELTPYWTRAYNLTWNLADGTLENEADLPDVIYADAPTIDFTKLVPKKDGYKFLYWSVSWLSAGNRYGVGYTETLSFNDGFNLPQTSSEPYITAVYSQVFTLKINLMGGNVDGSNDDVVIEFGKNEGTITFENPVKNGATLIGWSKYPDCSSEAEYSDLSGTKKYFTVNSDGTTSFSSSRLFGYNSSTGTNDLYEFETIYAIWDKVTVSFETNADGATMEAIVVDYNKYIDMTDSAYALGITNDKKFGGWYKDAELTIACSDSTRFYKDTTVYAKWLSKLTVTLVFEDGTTDEQYIYEGETIESISYNVGAGQYLGGVYFDAELTDKLSYSEQNNYKPKGDITLYVVRKAI